MAAMAGISSPFLQRGACAFNFQQLSSERSSSSPSTSGLQVLQIGRKCWPPTEHEHDRKGDVRGEPMYPRSHCSSAVRCQQFYGIRGSAGGQRYGGRVGRRVKESFGCGLSRALTCARGATRRRARRKREASLARCPAAQEGNNNDVSTSTADDDGANLALGTGGSPFSSSMEELLAGIKNPYEMNTTEELFAHVEENGPPDPIPNFGYSQFFDYEVPAPKPSVPEPKENSIAEDFYKLGFEGHVEFNGVEFLKHDFKGWGLYAAEDFPMSQEPRVVMSIPVEVMLTCCTDLPWRFNPDIVPMGHPIFEVINSTDPENEWDVRLACLLLLGMDQKDFFWSKYADYLPTTEESTSLLLATQDELQEFQDNAILDYALSQQRRADALHAKYWPSDSVLRLKRLCRTTERFKWALGIARSRQFKKKLLLGPLELPSNVLAPYADMINHSFDPSCKYRWDRKERLLEVVLLGGQEISAGTELTVDYGGEADNAFYLKTYGFSLATNPFDTITFSEKNRVHRESFLSAFTICCLENEYYHAGADTANPFADGTMMAVARTLPTWSKGDWPAMPSEERVAAHDLQEEAFELLGRFPTTLKEDFEIWEAESSTKSPRWKAAVKFRIDRKVLLHKTIQALSMYADSLLF